MEEAQEILLNSLSNSGVLIPDNVSSIKHLTPTSLFSICSQSLRIIRDGAPSFPDLLPESMAEQFKICSDMAEAMANLGFVGDMSFHKFLYPSEEDLHKLVRFLIEKLSETSESGKSSDKKNIRVDILLHQKVGDKLADLNIRTEVPESSITEDDGAPLSKSQEIYIIPSKIDDKEYGASKRVASGNEESISELSQNLSSLKDKAIKMRRKIENLQNQEKALRNEVTSNSSELQHMEEEHELLKAAVEMAFDDQHSADFYVEQLNVQVDEKRRNLMELKSHWEASTKLLEEKKISLEESLSTTKPDIWEKHNKLIQIKQETQSILSEIRKREEEHSKLSADLAKQPKVANRRSYIHRITEITKNSRKQEADIDRILKETREIQLESNSIQERLHRTYAVVDEAVLREAKKDPVGKQAHKLLTSIHESFEQISEKILATDRIRREAADYEAKLSNMTSRSLNIDKLQADLDAIKKENEYLEQCLRE